MIPSLHGRVVLAVVILLAEFAVLEGAFRILSGSEAAPAFQSLFMQDPRVGYRLRPQARARYTTDEFSVDIAINAQGVRDDSDIGPKASDERRIVVLGDSLVLSVQVPFEQTFCHLLEVELNQEPNGVRWRVINAGVQGYGVVDEYLLYRYVAENFDPDLVLVAAFPGNAEAARDKEAWLVHDGPVAGVGTTTVTRVRRLVRASMVLQQARVRYDQLRARITGPTTERPLLSFLKDPPPEVFAGLAVARRATGMIAERAKARGARTAVVLMTARFQTDDPDYGRLVAIVRQAGGELSRDAATDRYREALAPLGLPTLDLLPILAEQPDRRDLFFQRNVHLTPRGHVVVAHVLADFLKSSGLAVQAARSTTHPIDRAR